MPYERRHSFLMERDRIRLLKTGCTAIPSTMPEFLPLLLRISQLPRSRTGSRSVYTYSREPSLEKYWSDKNGSSISAPFSSASLPFLQSVICHSPYLSRYILLIHTWPINPLNLSQMRQRFFHIFIFYILCTGSCYHNDIISALKMLF